MSSTSCEPDKVVFESGAERSATPDDERYDLICPAGLFALAKRYGLGAIHYGSYNWHKGIPEDNLYNHIIRHLNLFRMGDKEEEEPTDHLAAAAWGIFALIHFRLHCTCEKGLKRSDGTNQPAQD